MSRAVICHSLRLRQIALVDHPSSDHGLNLENDDGNWPWFQEMYSFLTGLTYGQCNDGGIMLSLTIKENNGVQKQGMPVCPCPMPTWCGETNHSYGQTQELFSNSTSECQDANKSSWRQIKLCNANGPIIVHVRVVLDRAIDLFDAAADSWCDYYNSYSSMSQAENTLGSFYDSIKTTLMREPQQHLKIFKSFHSIQGSTEAALHDWYLGPQSRRLRFSTDVGQLARRLQQHRLMSDCGRGTGDCTFCSAMWASDEISDGWDAILEMCAYHDTLEA